MSSQGSVAQAVPPIKLATNNAREQVNTVLKTLDELEERLSSVMRDAPPMTVPSNTDGSGGSSAHFAEIVTINALLDIVTNRLYTVIGRLEV